MTTGKTSFITSPEPNRPLSRYNRIRLLLNQNKIPIQESWDNPEIAEVAEDQYFVVTAPYAHRPDLISLKYYGISQLYWVIARANKMIDPFGETLVDKKLRIPDRDYVFQTVLAK